ncbi:MAG: anaerobic sulfatase maturase [Candidatus Coatesbacteria bacterium]
MQNLLIKPAGPDCNLACGYCFYRPKAALYPGESPRRMTASVLAELVRQYTVFGGETCSFCWQGGEPTLMGLGFFREACGWMERFGTAGQTMANSIQTNGILLDDEWGEFFARRRFFVGLSLDGPAAVHDRWRRDAGGRATFARVLRAARLLERHGVPFNVLAVVTRETADAPEAVYEYLVESGFRHLQFIPVAETGPDGSPTPASVPPAAWGEFLCRLFDRWLADDPPAASIRTFDGLVALAAGLPGAECIFEAGCARYAVVEHNGDVYACDFLVEPAWKLGNLTTEPLWTLLQGPRWQAFRALKPARPGACRACAWAGWCGGGCPTHRRVASAPRGGAGEFDRPSYFCASYKAFFAHAGDRIRVLAGTLSGSLSGPDGRGRAFGADEV